jgi:branched-chain amino acid transport system substrate-binding protein
VGVYGDLTGQTSFFGQSSKNGAQMAADEINAAGGINGRQVQLIVEDDQGEPGKAATAVAKLINQDQVRAIIGEAMSSNTMAAAPKARQAKIPMITSGFHPRVTEFDYVFRISFADPFQGEVMAKFAAKTLRAKRAAILFDPDSDYSKSLTNFFKQSFDGTIVDEETYGQSDRIFSKQLIAMRSHNPDVIFVPGYYTQAGLIVKQARQRGINIPILGGDGWDAPQLWVLGGHALNNTYIVNHFAIDDPSPLSQKFVADYESRYSFAPDALAALYYDAIRMLADAIKRAGTTNGPQLRDTITQTRGFLGVTGTINMNRDGSAEKPAIILELRDGRFVYRATIQPDVKARD